MDNSSSSNANSAEKQKKPFWTCEPFQEVDRGISEADKSQSIYDVLEASANKFQENIYLTIERDNIKRDISFLKFRDNCISFAASLVHLGFQPRQAVCILGFNSPEWFTAEIGAIVAGGIGAGIYSTNSAEACYYILQNCEAMAVITENDMQTKKILQVCDRLPHLKVVVQWTGKIASSTSTSTSTTDEGNSNSTSSVNGFHVNLYDWDTFIELGNEEDRKEVLERRVSSLNPHHCCSLIYTSGTTGMPKAVMLSHDNIITTSIYASKLFYMKTNESMISYLPLSHIAAQLVDIYCSLLVGIHIYFARPDALKGSLLTTLKQVQPTLFLAVPRVWEKIQEKMIEAAKTLPNWKKHVSSWAKRIGLEGTYGEQKGLSKPWGWWLANTLVFRGVKEALGLNRIRVCATSAAPISRDTLDFFMSLNIPILEMFGLSECTGPVSLNIIEKHRTGSVGIALPCSEIKIDHPDQDGIGEICVRGRNVFMGYLHNEKETTAVFDSEGWFHTGDLGNFDRDNFLYITGRIKELIITAGGENIPPVLIEDEIKLQLGNVISNVMLVGDRRKFLSALVTLKAKPKESSAVVKENNNQSDTTTDNYPFSDELDDSALHALEKAGISGLTSVKEAAEDPRVKEYIQNGIEKANRKAISNAQNVQKFVILSRDFTMETNDMTPTLKLKRRVVAEKYSSKIESMYADTQG